jgi:hypothetical protein
MTCNRKVIITVQTDGDDAFEMSVDKLTEHQAQRIVRRAMNLFVEGPPERPYHHQNGPSPRPTENKI